MKAYSDLAQDVGYVAKLRTRSRDSAATPRHFSSDHTGRSNLATRKLLKASSDGCYEEVWQLLRIGANASTSDSRGRTPLHFAASRGDTTMVQLLLEYGAVANMQDGIGNTALHLACCCNHVSVVTALLRAGSDVNKPDRHGKTPLHLAHSRLRMLRMKGSDEVTQTPLDRKRETDKIIEMIQIYLNAFGPGNSKKDVDELEKLAGQLSLSETSDQVDEIQELLQGFTELSLQRSESEHPLS